MDFDEVICYSGRGGDNEPFIRDEIGGQYTTTSSNQALKKPTPTCKIAIVTYGNGVVESMQARRGLVDRQVITTEEELDLIDCPYLSDVPKGLERLLAPSIDDSGRACCYDHVLFSDICKEGPASNIFSSTITTLRQKKQLLPESWAFVGAPRTCNPLGSTVTFLNSDRIECAVKEMVGLDHGHGSRRGRLDGNAGHGDGRI